MNEQPQVYHRSLKLMGNRFQLSAVGFSEESAQDCIEAGIHEIRRIEKKLTTYNDESETAFINRNAGIQPVKISKETFDLIERSKKISRVTQGAFDITYGSVDKNLWNFNTKANILPDLVTAKEMKRLINYRNILMNYTDYSIMLKEKGMRIGFGGIGKGYAAERAKLIMQGKGVKSGIVNASGDMTTWGLQPNGKPWTVGIADPNLKESIFSYIDITDMSVATSGNYEKFIIVDGKKYSHTIDPRTGMPISGIKSVTILSTNAEIADAMTTPVMIMGVDAGLNLINQMQNVETIIVDDNDKLYISNNIRLN
jgi:FAD:protein FMN transferase